MKRLTLLAVLVVFALSFMTTISPAEAMTGKKAGRMMYTKSAVDLRLDMRKLWEDHITWTRCFIVSALADLEDAGPVAERLLRNQDDIGNAIKPFYGDDAGKKLAALLRDHILIAAGIVKAAKANNKEEYEKGQKNWYANADDLSVFLSGANPNWPKKALQDMLYKHLEYTTAEVASRLKKDWAADIEAYDKGHAHMLMFSDAVTEGIVKQFPKKFGK